MLAGSCVWAFSQPAAGRSVQFSLSYCHVPTGLQVPSWPLQEQVPAGFKGWRAKVVGADATCYDDGIHCTVKFEVSDVDLRKRCAD